ncbi:efflux RND transporter periplasmic adaptor subunit [bacterium]|nr:efflux RND transporter periplasmic adaptor subunit [bacterium]
MNSIKISTVLLINLISSHVFASKVWIKAQVRELQPYLMTSAVINPAKSELIKVGANSMLTGIKVKVGQKVKAGELVATSDISYMEEEKASLDIRVTSAIQDQKQANLDYETAKKKQTVMNNLAAKDIIPRVEAENYQVTVLEARKTALMADTALKSAEADLEEFKKKLKGANYYSPISGIVSYLIVDPQQMRGHLMADYDSLLAKIDEPHRFMAWTELMDTQVVKIQKGKKAKVLLEGSTIAFDGTVTQVSSFANPKTGLFRVGVEFQKEGQPIPVGVTARVEIKDGPAKRALALPWNAVQVSGDRAWVMLLQSETRKVASKSNEFEKRGVQLGLRTEGQVEILAGIKDGDIVEADLW